MFWSQILYSSLTHQMWTMGMTRTRMPVSILSTPPPYLCKVSWYCREMWHTVVRVDPEHPKHAQCHATTGRAGARRWAPLGGFLTICAKFFGFVNQLLCQLSLAIIQVKEVVDGGPGASWMSCNRSHGHSCCQCAKKTLPQNLWHYSSIMLWDLLFFRVTLYYDQPEACLCNYHAV